jgi:ubiquinone/menaquinone biosynthesis C-methylase UbiE
MRVLTVAAKRLFPDFQSRLRVRRIINSPLDIIDTLTGRRDSLAPPRGLWFVGGRKKYETTNEQYLAFFSASGLRPECSVLDIGCGIGVMAVRLTRFLTTGRYEGFDVVKVGTDWATAHIGARFPNFRFTHADMYNHHYNPQSSIPSETYSFQYPDDQFDFAFAKSVFTHMTPPGVKQYLHEAARVIKRGGTAIVSAFMINQESAALIKAGKSSLALSPMDQYWTVDTEFPETAIGLPETDFIEWCRSAGFQVKQIAYGSWCGRTQYLSYQDIIALTCLK